jgi:malate dehydrogenase
VKLGSDGVEEVVEWDLPTFERDALADASEKLSDQYDRIS